ncbi:MAG TPA: TetR/AcrR family transcriptional regulator [Phenylobacterium sp.]|nr:TetR/AcrR family transcriptional regulator [Phenylobacterium sp.]
MEREAKVRVLKPPSVRRAELIDCAQGLFLTRGYERTTINDVISATGLSKGAFYHHFRSKEDLLEAIADRFARESLGFIAALQADAGLDALQRLNRLLALSRDWKRGHIAELKAMFTTLLRPENAVLYHRIVEAVFAVLAPALAEIIRQGEAEGVFDAGDPRAAADTLLWLSNGRRGLVIAALALAETDAEAGVRMIVERVRAEEGIASRVLGLRSGGVDMLGSEDVLRGMLVDWSRDGGGARPHDRRDPAPTT